MTAGRFGKPPSEAPDNSTADVNRFADDREALDLLRSLAPLHQRYAVRRGLRALGIEGEPPSLDDLALAVEAPHPPVTDIGPCFEGDRLFAWAIQQYLGDPRFETEDGEFDAVQALEAARNIVGPAARARRLEENRQAWANYRRAKEMHARWNGLAKWLADFAQRMAPWVPDSRLAAMPEPELRELAITSASRCADDIRASRLVELAADGTPYLVETGEVLDWPLPDLTPTERRLMCPLHWRRRLRKRAKCAQQFWSAALQTVGGRGGTPYADDYAHDRWQERQDAAREHGSTHVLIGRDGTRLSLLDVMKSSVAATLNRVYVMTVGIEQIATGRELVPIFITLTLPPEYHPNPKDGDCSWTPEFAPAAADAELARLWAVFRTHLDNCGLATLGMRVFEGHQDGCPHLHALLYVPPGAVGAVDRELQTVRPEPANPPIDQKTGRPRRVATKLEVIDTRRARAASYVMKYILKALNQSPEAAVRDERLEADARRAIADAVLTAPDDEDDRQIENFDRHRALASERGWRRFAFLGVHGIQRIWQRLYTLDKAPDDAPENIREAHAAMRERRWGDAILALGALRSWEGEHRVKLDYDERANAYGETRRVPARILDERSGWTLPIHSQGWTLEKTQETAPLTVAVSCPRAGAAPRPLAAPEQAFVKKLPAEAPSGAPPPGRAPPPGARSLRRSMLTMPSVTAAEVA